ncbi:hypothetical protein CEXT_65311 [Caerostris extrusa]|uniref:Uncharacterized protein n=1 Tax=Caerostris extrusa TaxID=172846 RepID=A0AAV4V300_CAEEX|nr:hypothetical protein CEXT_65311 [Caerostris extrusa]
MSECQVEFSQPLTKGTITHLVIEYLKFVLYTRGQLPDPLDTLIQSIKGNTPFENLNMENHVIFCDDPNVRCDRSGLLKKNKSITGQTKTII